MSDVIIKQLIKRQNQISYLYSPSDEEVYTPIFIVRQKLDKLPENCWKNPNLKFLDPSCKSGIYLSEVIIRLMVGLTEWESDENKRHHHIITKMVFGYVYTKVGEKITKKLLYGDSNYNCDNIRFGLFHKDENLKVKEFDIILGNPPYNMPRKEARVKGVGGPSGTLWDEFVKKALWVLKDDGYLAFIHPPGWRRPEHELWKVLSSKQIEYLEIHARHTESDKTSSGQKIFNAKTAFDWYILKNCKNTNDTFVKDVYGNISKIDLKEWPWLPASNFDIIKGFFKKIDELPFEIFKVSGDFSREKTDEYKYPCINSTLVDGELNIVYTKTKKGYLFDIPKLIFSDSNSTSINIVIDVEKKYGICSHGLAIPVSDIIEAEKLKSALQSSEFLKILYTSKWSNFQIDYKMFKYFRKDFWKEFINGN